MSADGSEIALNNIESKLQAYRDTLDDKDRTALAMEICNDYSAAVGQQIDKGNYDEAEKVFPLWYQFLESLGTLQNQILVCMLFVQYHTKISDSNGLIAFDAYQLESNFIDAASRYYRAEHHCEQAIKYNRKMLALNAADAQNQGIADTVANQGIFLDRCLADTQGMHALIEGELKLEGGNYTTAAEFLDKAITDLSRAEKLAKDESQQWLEESPMPTFTNFARALRHRTETEIQLINGDLVKAAEAEKLRAQALRDSSREHSISELASSEFFRLRTKRDQILAEERARFLALASEQKKVVSLPSRLLFPALAFAGIGLLVYMTRDFAVMQNPAVFVFVLLFSMVVAAITANLTSYKEGESTLLALARAAKQSKETKEEK